MVAAAAKSSWSDAEVEAVVASYLQMLKLELAGQRYSKSAHRREVIPKLRDRSDGSVEFKYQNVSAVLVDLGAPWILGYKPRSNFQHSLYDEVEKHLRNDRSLDEVLAAAMERPTVPPAHPDFTHFMVDAPALSRASAPAAPAYVRRQAGIRRDYLGIEARNRSLGLAGEQYVVEYERHRLILVGAERYAARVEHVSRTRGDGLGFDVLSYESDGRERLIEVKTTAFGQEAPFYLTQNELALSRSEPKLFRLARVFEFRQRPRMFELAGPVDNNCHLDPAIYRAHFALPALAR